MVSSASPSPAQPSPAQLLSELVCTASLYLHGAGGGGWWLRGTAAVVTVMMRRTTDLATTGTAATHPGAPALPPHIRPQGEAIQQH